MSDCSRLSNSSLFLEDARVTWNKLKGNSVFMNQRPPICFPYRIVVVLFEWDRRARTQCVMCLVSKSSGKWTVRTRNFQPFQCRLHPTREVFRPPWRSATSLTRWPIKIICSCELSWMFLSFEKGCSSNGESVPGTPGILTPSGVPRKESYKMQRKNYRYEKKKAANELLCTLKDPTVIVLADWLKGASAASVSQDSRSSVNPVLINFILFSSRNIEKLDKALVRTQTRAHSALQERQIQGSFNPKLIWYNWLRYHIEYMLQ